MSGDAGAEFEKQSPEVIVQRVLGVLERIFKPKGIAVPQPVQVLRLQICQPQSFINTARRKQVPYGLAKSGMSEPCRSALMQGGSSTL